MKFVKIIAFVLLLLCSGIRSFAAEVTVKTPPRLAEQVILDAESFVQANENAYLAFPALVRTDGNHVLISYKRGRSHASDTGAPLEVVRFNTTTKEVESRKIVSDDPQLIYQMGEWLRLPDGTLGNFVDVQKVVKDQGRSVNHRVGVQYVTTADAGEHYSSMKPLGKIDGIEYGYVFDGVEVDGILYVLAMTFPELSDLKTRYDDRGKRIFGTVTALAYDGNQWKFVRNLTKEFGGTPINESCLVAKDDGFIVATRGYDSKVRLHRVNSNFEEQQSRNLTTDYSIIYGIVGRPRLFQEDGHLYLLGRSYRKKNKMELALFRVDEETLNIEQCAILGPESSQQIVDGYYAMHFFTGEKSDRRFHVVTYRRQAGSRNPDIVRLEFNWSDVH